MRLKRTWVYIGIALLAAIIVFFAFGGKSYTDEEILNINLREHSNLALHIHPHLKIAINGEEYPIPPNIGISATGMRVIHTHESDGNLHVESPVPHQFYLSDFFAIWGKRLTNECIFEYCSSEGTLKFYVNGEESTLGPDIPLYDRDQIEVVYEAKP
jgi:hypothetical protein